MSANLFIPVQFKTSVQLKPNELDADYEAHLLYKLQEEYEGKCSRHGFIKPKSLSIVQRSMGRLMKPHFNGHIRFEVVVLGEVCNPVEGMVVSAVVKNKNVLGILAESSIRVEGGTLFPVLDIIIPKRTAGISSEIPLDELNIGDVIQVEILGKRFQLHDQRISIIGRGVESAESVQVRRQKMGKLGSIDEEGLYKGDDREETGEGDEETMEGGYSETGETDDENDTESVGGVSLTDDKRRIPLPEGDDDIVKPFGDGDEFDDVEDELDALSEEDIPESDDYCSD